MKRQKYKANMNYGELMAWRRWQEYCFKQNMPIKISKKEYCLYAAGYIVFAAILILFYFVANK